MPSDVDIVNHALSMLGEARISSLNQNTKPARTASAIYEITRDNELRAHNWSFAMARAMLPALSDVPLFGYGHAYELPADYLRLIQAGRFSPGGQRVIGTVTDGSDYRIEGRAILTDLPSGIPNGTVGPLPIRYMRKITDPTMFDSSFVNALGCRLAMKLCEDLTQDPTKRKLAAQEYQEAVMSAIKTNAIELPPDPLPDNSWLLSRSPG